MIYLYMNEMLACLIAHDNHNNWLLHHLKNASPRYWVTVMAVARGSGWSPRHSLNTTPRVRPSKVGGIMYGCDTWSGGPFVNHWQNFSHYSSISNPNMHEKRRYKIGTQYRIFCLGGSKYTSTFYMEVHNVLRVRRKPTILGWDTIIQTSQLSRCNRETHGFSCDLTVSRWRPHFSRFTVREHGRLTY